MKIKKFSLLAFTITALLSAGYSTTSFAAEKNSCDIMDAPDVDLSEITSDLQAKIDELNSLQSFLKEARADLADSADKEETYSALLKIATATKTASGIILAVGSFSPVVAGSSTVFVSTLISNLASTVNDAVNANNQKDLLEGLAKNNLDKWSITLDALGKAKAFTGAWTGLSTAYDTFTNFMELSDAWNSKTVLRSQLKGVDRQISNLNTKITTLKTNLTKMKKLVGDNEKILDKGFLDLINKAKKDTIKTCDDPCKKIDDIVIKTCSISLKDYSLKILSIYDQGGADGIVKALKNPSFCQTNACFENVVNSNLTVVNQCIKSSGVQYYSSSVFGYYCNNLTK